MFAVINNPVLQNSESKDPTSLDNLHDLALPSEIPFWPPAFGWYSLAIGLFLLTVWILVKVILAYFSSAYRRAALIELDRIRTDSADAEQRPRVVIQLNQLLKRVALARWSRDRVAGYSGHGWLDFLNRTGKSNIFSQSQIEALRDSAYSSRIREKITAQQLGELIDKAEIWIRSHQVSYGDAGEGEDLPS